MSFTTPKILSSLLPHTVDKSIKEKIDEFKKYSLIFTTLSLIFEFIFFFFLVQKIVKKKKKVIFSFLP